ncbi:cellulose binding domain-containing protein [Dactylosporangium sp. NPDC000244]|uniref:cellulose binding domain-containing protein n=1 Tax=Dactylosporangium sp. NPDC000244 TaxID=3154365 RepID=UPI0033269283
MNRFLVAVATAAAVVAAAAAPARAAVVPGAATATFTKQSAWATGYTGQYTIDNGTPAPLTWRLEFDLPGGTTIANAWGATITHSGNHYVALGESWNAVVAPGGSATFGWLAQGTGGPLTCSLNGASCAGAADIRPPSTPGHLRTSIGTNTFTLRWDASGDDTGVKGYEVYNGAGLVATVTGTEYTMPTPPPAIITYRVRALDAAGNASPFAVITPGGPADTVAPGMPPVVYPGMTVIRWTAATDDVAVAGYDVYVNGDHYGATSNLSLTVPPLGFGEFTYKIVAFDGAGNRSEPRSLSVAIDPGPTSDSSRPTIPGDLRVSVSATQVTWSWTASADNVGVAGYQLFHGPDWIGDTTATTFAEPRAAGQTVFGIRVRAFDAIGNKSAFATLTVVLDPPPPVP